MTNLGEKPGTGTPAFPFPTADNHDAHATPASAPKVEHPTEEALDHGIEESFPASDPVSVSVTGKLPPAAASTSVPGTVAEAATGASGGGPGLSSAVAPTAPGDDAPAGTPGTGESLCRDCGGTGRAEGGGVCPTCEGLGKVNVGVGGG
jgi:hypothetical protein